MSEFVVICPNCGAAVSAQVKVESVRVDAARLLVAFGNVWCDHACEVTSA